MRVTEHNLKQLGRNKTLHPSIPLQGPILWVAYRPSDVQRCKFLSLREDDIEVVLHGIIPGVK